MHQRAVRRIAPLFLLGVILLIAAGTRSYRLGAHCLWVDEIQSYLGATGTQFRTYTAIPQNIILDHPPRLTDPAHLAPWWQTLRPDTQDIHPPLYFFLLRCWTALFGWSEAATRSMTVVASVIAVGLLFFTVREFSGDGAGLAAAAIMAVAQPQIYMSQEARSYELVLAMALAATWTVARIERRGVTLLRLWALAGFCILMLLTHYYSAHVVATLGLYVLIRFRGRPRRATLAAIGGAVLLFAVAWGPVLYMQRHGWSGSGTTVFGDVEPDHFHQTFLRLSLITARSLYEPLPNAAGISVVFSIIVFLPLFFLRKRPDLLIWTLWVPINVIPTLLLDLTHHTWTLGIERYTLPATLGVYALIATLGQSFSRKWRYALPVLAVIGCVLHINQAYFTEDRRSQQKWRELADFYRQLSRPDDLTIFASGRHDRYDYMFYLCLTHYLPSLPGPAILLQHPSPQVLQTLRSYPNVIVVGDGDATEVSLPGAKVVNFRPIVFLGAIARIRWVDPTSAASDSTSKFSAATRPR